MSTGNESEVGRGKLCSVILGVAATLAAGVLVWQPCEARVVEFVVEQQSAFVGGESFGKAGPFEMLRGTAYMEVDPRDPRNAVIVDIKNAPRNARGRVEFSTQFLIVKPVDMGRSNHKIFYAVNNRGNNLEGLLTATTAAQVAGTDAGWAMSQGYTIVDAGWEGDVIPTPTKLVASLPRARHKNGEPITGLMRYEYSDRAAGSFTTNLEGTPGFLSYEAADTNPANATFTVSSSEYGPKTPIPPDRWAFGSCPTGPASLQPTTTDLCYFDGFDNAKIYEIIYTAKNPIVMALGFAATRDVASFLRFSARDDFGNPNPIGKGARRAYAGGGSQTGGFLRDYIYLGFNEDESGRKVFDGIMPWIAGTDRVFINVRFADPNTYSEQDRQHNYLQTSYPPFTYAISRDPISGIRDGIMKRPRTDPLVMQIDSQSEFWQLHGSLNVVDGHGHPVPIPENVRLYYVNNSAHGFVSGSFFAPTPGTATLCSYGTPTSGLTWNTLRASLRNLDRWADGDDGRDDEDHWADGRGRDKDPSAHGRGQDKKDGYRAVMPPKSNYPSLRNGTLVTLDEATAAFPQIPQVDFPTVLDTYEALNFGPLFNSQGGIITIQPPENGPSYTILVPKSDENGIDLAGVHQIESRAPIGTSVGWNIRTPAHRGPNLCVLTGSYFPFANTVMDQVTSGDPRPSLVQLYGSHDGFVAAVKKAAYELVREGFLLSEDANAAINTAENSSVLK
jgi:Alpha/beta hydrolase domain